MSTTMTISLEDDVSGSLDRMATATQRDKAALAAEAIRQYIEVNEWQVAEVIAGLQEADAGDFASDAEVTEFARKWSVNAR